MPGNSPHTQYYIGAGNIGRELYGYQREAKLLRFNNLCPAGPLSGTNERNKVVRLILTGLKWGPRITGEAEGEEKGPNERRYQT